MTSGRQTVKSLSFFRFMAKLEQSRSRILDAQYVKLTFSLTVTLYLRKSGNKTRKPLIQLSHYCFEQRYYFGQKIVFFLQKDTEISKIKRALVMKGTFSETTYVCVLTYQISSFQHISNKLQIGWGLEGKVITYEIKNSGQKQLILQQFCGNYIWGSKGINYRTSIFNIFLTDWFFIMKDTNIASYAHDSTLYVSADDIDQVISLQKKLQKFYLNGSMIT